MGLSIISMVWRLFEVYHLIVTGYNAFKKIVIFFFVSQRILQRLNILSAAAISIDALSTLLIHCTLIVVTKSIEHS